MIKVVLHVHAKQVIFICDFIHVIELLCYKDLQIFGWRFGLITGDFLSTYLMHVFIVY